MDTIEVLRDFTLGNVRVTTHTVADYDPDYSYLGRFISDPSQAKREEYVYDRNADAMMLPGKYADDPGAWRDHRGRIVSTPEDPGWRRRDNQYIACGDQYKSDEHALTYAFQDASRLAGLVAGDWWYVGIACNVTVDGVTIGEFSVWGFETDGSRSDGRYLRSEARNIEHEAIHQAREWFARREKVAS